MPVLSGRPPKPADEVRETLQAYVKRRTARRIKELARRRRQSIASLLDEICEEWLMKQEEETGERSETTTNVNLE
jgi:hypothetical protein